MWLFYCDTNSIEGAFQCKCCQQNSRPPVLGTKNDLFCALLQSYVATDASEIILSHSHKLASL